MFNENNNFKGVKLIKGRLYKDNNILVSSAFINMLSNY